MPTPTRSLAESLNELLSQLGESDVQSESEGLTMEEMALLANVSLDYIKDRVRLLVAAGKLDVGKKKQKQLDGQMKYVNCYFLPKAQKGEQPNGNKKGRGR